MKTSALVFLAAAVGSANAFVTNSQSNPRPATELFGGATKYATSKEGKADRVAVVKELLETSEMILTVPASGLTVAEVQNLRRSLPEGTTMSVIKNKLMARAIEGTDYECAGDMLKGANMWFFIDEDISGTLKAYKAFCKDKGKKDTHPILGGAMEGVAYDVDGVEAISNLPSKIELIARIAGGIKAVPTKLARVVKEPGNKMARAIKLATEKEE